MDYMGIVKRAWSTTWRYKILWLFGLFAGAGGSGGGNYSSWNSGGSSGSGASSGIGNANSYDEIARQLTPYLPLVITVAVFVGLISLLFFVLTFAAQGGLVHLVNEAEEGRPVRAGDGWREGFRRWGRVFFIDFLVGIPIILLVIVILLVFGASIVGLVAGGTGLDSNASSGAALGALGAGIGGLCFGILLLVVFSIAYAIVFGTMAQMALRYAVLHDMTAWESLKQGWRDVWGKRGAVLMFFVTWVTGFVYGIALAVVVGVLAVPAALLAVAQAWPAASAMGLLTILAAMVPAAVYGAFLSSAWTIFFRRMTGAESAAAAPAYAGGYPPQPPAYPAAPAAPAYGAPPAPPSSEAPSAAAAPDAWTAANQVPESPPDPWAAPSSESASGQWASAEPPMQEAPAVESSPPAPPAPDAGEAPTPEG